MNFEDFKSRKRRAWQGRRMTKDIRDRWESRVLANHWQHAEDGAERYLRRYGRNIGVDKCIRFAVYSETCGYPWFAHGMWEKAYRIEYPEQELTRYEPDPNASESELPDIFHL